MIGGLAQLARAPALHAGAQRFESVILHFFLINNEELIIKNEKQFFQTSGCWLLGLRVHNSKHLHWSYKVIIINF